MKSYEEIKKELLEKEENTIKRIESGEMVYSHSSFSAFMKSPRHFMNYKVLPRKTTASMEMGTLTHLLLLEPDEFDDTYLVVPDKIRSNSEDYKKKQVEAGGRDVIRQSMYDSARMKRDAILNDEAASELLSQCHSFEGKTNWDYSGVPFIGYIDAKGDEIIVDLKITNPDPNKLKWSIRYNQYAQHEGEYGRQGAHYTYGAGNYKHKYFIIAVDDKLSPSIIEVKEDTREQHYTAILHYIDRLGECIEEKRWNESYGYYANKLDGIYRF